jgi:hypothetical protein
MYVFRALHVQHQMRSTASLLPLVLPWKQPPRDWIGIRSDFSRKIGI